jgi:hypothetical protein
LRVLASFDSKLQVVLKPDIFGMLTRIGDLFVAKVHDEEYHLKKMQKRIDSSLYYGTVSYLNKTSLLSQFTQRVAVLEKVGNLAIFDERDPSNPLDFDVDGCLDEAHCELSGTMLRLVNKHRVECTLQLSSQKTAERWQHEVREIAMLVKKETDTALRRAESVGEEEKKQEEQQHDNAVLLQFEFSAPDVCLLLNT